MVNLYVYNSNAANVGVGVNPPLSKFHLAGNMLVNNINPIIQFQQDGVEKGFIQLSSDNIRLGTNSSNTGGKVVFRTSGTDHVVVDSLGQVGIGTTTPGRKLHVRSGSIYVQDNRTNENPQVIFDIPGVDFKEGGLQFQRSGDTLAAIHYVANPNTANYIKIASSNSGKGNDLVVNSNGYTGLSVLDPQVRLHVRDNSNDELIRMDGISPTIKLRKRIGTLGFFYDDIGFLQTVENDIRIGTYSSNTGGKFIVRTGGDDRVFVTESGNVGINTSLPSAKLQVHASSGGENLRIYAPTGGLIQFTSGIVTSQLLKGFLDVEGNDFRIGTNSANNNGNFIVRVNGTNRVIVDPIGTVNMPAGIDAGLASNGLLMLGDVGSSNIVMDNNEIIARNNGGTSTLILQNDGGSVRIGNVSVPSGYKFAVNGRMICEELKVKVASTGWPDYVFDDKYKLPSLDELKNFIAENKHLPNIPSAAEVEKNGLEIGDMQKRMMEKIEELTLYILQQQKEIEELKARIDKK